MNSNTEKAKALLEESGCTCVFAFGGQLEQCSERGLRPLLAKLGADALPAGFSAADKVVGKAPAFLYVLLGAGEVYAPVMSEAAASVLAENGIQAHCGQTVKQIVNRAGTGICPMEEAVAGIAEPAAAAAAIKARLISLSGKK